MKKSIFLLLAAAMTACSNQDILTDVQKQENKAQSMIGFASYSENATKGDVTTPTNLEYYHKTFAVYGTKKSVISPYNVQYVFGGAATASGTQDGDTCTYTNLPDLLGDWSYTDPRYWDRQANYVFTAYAPVSANNPIRYNFYGANYQVGDYRNKFITTTSYTLHGTNLQATPTSAEKNKGFTVEAGGDLDLMIADYPAYSGNSHPEYVTFVFRHILSKLNVKIDKTEALQNSTVTIDTIIIVGLKDSGTYDELQYDNSESMISGWTASLSDDPDTIRYAGDQVLNSGWYTYNGDLKEFHKGAPIYFIESLIMPQAIADDQATLIVKYTIKSGEHTEAYKYHQDLYDISQLRKFFDGFNYTLLLTIGPDMIKFDSKVSTWDNQTVIENNIQQ